MEELLLTPEVRRKTVSRYGNRLVGVNVSRISEASAVANKSSADLTMSQEHPGRFTERDPGACLERSLNLLDEAMGIQSGGMFRKIQTPEQSTLYQSRREVSGIDATSPMIGKSFQDRSVAWRSTNVTALGDTAMFEETMETNVPFSEEEHAGMKATEDLYEEFLTSIQSHPSEHQIFDMVAEFEQTCSDHVAVLRSLWKKVPAKQGKSVAEVLEALLLERNTWRLLGSLYQDRLNSDAAVVDSDDMMVDSVGKTLSEKEIVVALYERDALIRQSQLVIDWLERNAADDLAEDFYDKVEFFSDSTVTWENTLHALKNSEKDIPGGSERPIVTELDPDAPIRQNRPLHDLDKEDEARLVRYLFAHIRAGQLDQAQQLCTRCGQPWRAATLEGWRLYHDPNYSQPGQDGERKPVEGNPNRDIWKLVAWRMTEDERLPVYERAIYASLCGNLKALSTVCISWDDLVWAFFKVMVDVRVENEIQANFTNLKKLGPSAISRLPLSYWESKLMPRQIFQEIQATENDKIQHEAMNPFYVIQRYVILDDVDGLMEEMGTWLQGDGQVSSHLLRLMAHLVLLFRKIGRSCKEELCTFILEEYVKDLIEQNQIRLVAYYVSTLPSEEQVLWYAKFLERVTDAEDRKLCLHLAEEVGLNVSAITKMVVENIRTREEAAAATASDLAAETTEEDLCKIEALDWLVFDPSQRVEAVCQASALIRSFLVVRKLDAARKCFTKIPPDSINMIMKQWQMQAGTAELPARQNNAIREYLCIQTYLDAQDAFVDWFEYFHHAKPQEPKLVQGATFTERVAHEHKVKQYEVDLDRWKMALNLQTKVSKTKLYNVLLFPDGWMVDQQEDDLEDSGRYHQMEVLRQLCIPQVMVLLHSVMYSTQQYKESLQLSDLLASEQHQLYKVYKEEELQEFLRKMRESSLQLLENGCDPWGYQST